MFVTSAELQLLEFRVSIGDAVMVLLVAPDVSRLARLRLPLPAENLGGADLATVQPCPLAATLVALVLARRQDVLV
jgi:hypothetical protein